jgi:hypothetical protein
LGVTNLPSLDHSWCSLYGRLCKVKIPWETGGLSWLPKWSEADDILKIRLNLSIKIESEWVPEFIDLIHDQESFVNNLYEIGELSNRRWFDEEKGYDEDKDVEALLDQNEFENWCEFTGEGEILSHKIQENLNTWIINPEPVYENENSHQYVDNWIEIKGKIIRLEDLRFFNKTVYGGMFSDLTVQLSPFRFKTFLEDEEYYAELLIEEDKYSMLEKDFFKALP